jgi:hypothetical protein
MDGRANFYQKKSKRSDQKKYLLQFNYFLPAILLPTGIMVVGLWKKPIRDHVESSHHFDQRFNHRDWIS